MEIKDVIEIILAISSFLCMIGSIIIVVLTIKQNNKMLEESTRPYISIYATKCYNGSMYIDYLVIRNYGSTAATIERLEYDFDFIPCYSSPQTSKDWLKELIGTVIVPGQSKICYMDFDKISKPVVFQITYKTGAGKKYTDNVTVDFSKGNTLEDVYTPRNQEDALKKLVGLLHEKMKKDL